jgi:hypothetical protein
MVTMPLASEYVAIKGIPNQFNTCRGWWNHQYRGLPARQPQIGKIMYAKISYTLKTSWLSNHQMS